MNTLKTQVDRNKKHFYAYLVAFYFFLTPFEDLMTSAEFGTILKYMAMLIAVVIFAYLFLSNRKITFSKLSILALSLVVLSWASLLWSVSVDTTIQRNVAYTLLPFLFTMIGLVPYNDAEKKMIMHGVILGGLCVSAYLFVNGGGLLSGRLILTEGNDPNNFAALLFLPLGLCVYGFWDKGLSKYRVVYLVCFAIILVPFLLTGSRGGLFTLIAFFVAYIIFGKKVKSVKNIIALIAVALLMVFILEKFVPERIIDRLLSHESYKNTKESNNQRWQVWKCIIQNNLPDMPAWGYGAGCQQLLLIPFYGHIKGAHNTYLTMLVEFGIFGLPIFLVFLYVLFIKLKRKNLHIGIALLVGICVCIFFLDSYPKKFLWNVLILLYIMISPNREVQQNNVKNKKQIHENTSY